MEAFLASFPELCLKKLGSSLKAVFIRLLKSKKNPPICKDLGGLAIN